jgi:hypothetical protein
MCPPYLPFSINGWVFHNEFTKITNLCCPGKILGSIAKKAIPAFGGGNNGWVFH